MEAPLPGLGPGVPRWKLNFAWSVSRHHRWTWCKRAWWYDVVAPTLPRSPVPWAELDRMRKLSSAGVLQGQAVHEALEVGIHAARAGQPALAPARRAHDAALRPFAVHPETIAEVANGAPFDGEGLEAARKGGLAMVERFFAEVWPRYARRRYLHHEEPRRLVAAGHRVNLRVDLLTAGPEGLLVTDWKTGRDQGHGHDLQLGTYLLWASRALREEPARTRAELVFLADGTQRSVGASTKFLEAAEGAIGASAQAMLAVQGMEDAPPSPGSHCLSCGFLAACPEGRAALGR